MDLLSFIAFFSPLPPSLPPLSLSLSLSLSHTHTHTHTARPVPRKASEASHARDALLAGAGVAVIGQRRKPRQLET